MTSGELIQELAKYPINTLVFFQDPYDESFPFVLQKVDECAIRHMFSHKQQEEMKVFVEEFMDDDVTPDTNILCLGA